MRVLLIAFGLMLIATPVCAQAGANPMGELAMHVIASGEYLYCQELTTPGTPYFPVDCNGINNSVSAAELSASFGYGYLVFCCYNVAGITGVEFAVTGVPAGRSGYPPVSYCPESTLAQGSLLDPSSGGILAFGECLEPVVPCGGMIGFAYVALLGPMVTGAMGQVDYVPSVFSNESGLNYFLDCSTGYIVDPTYSEHGCTLNGVHPEMVPYEDCDPGATATELNTWSNVKAMYR